MALTPTTKIKLGFDAPPFSLVDVVTKNKVNYPAIRGEKGTLVMFICNHCPYVIHVREELIRLANDYACKGIGFVAISSNDVERYPQDSPDKMEELALEMSFPFPYLYDETQAVAKVYDAACTPDFSLFDANDKCVYRGQLDDSTPGNEEPVTGNSMRQVLNQLLAGEKIDEKNQKPSLGCSIKWK